MPFPRLTLLGIFVAAAAAWSAPAFAQTSPDAAALAELSVRLTRLEEEIATLTGRLEESEFRRQQLEQRLDALEGGTPAGPVAQPQAPPGPRIERVGPQQPAPQAEQGMLGRVDPSTVPNSPRGWTPAEPANPNDPQAVFDNAYGLLRVGSYDAAQRELERFLERFPDHALAPEASYWLAETLYVQGQYAEAAKRFGGNFKSYGPDATKAPDSLLKLGMSLGALGETEQACRTLNELARVYPTGPASVVQAAQRERQRLACG